TDDMLIVRGVNIFPTQIEEVVLQNDKLSGIYQILLSREGLLDEVEVHCELQINQADLPPPEVAAISNWLSHRIKSMVGISTRVKVLPPDSIERSATGKARRVIDRRPR
ncbi:MAG TPA: phenylacetate--CoA ligase, partial [Burkholderiaceae bacterium]